MTASQDGAALVHHDRTRLCKAYTCPHVRCLARFKQLEKHAATVSVASCAPGVVCHIRIQQVALALLWVVGACAVVKALCSADAKQLTAFPLQHFLLTVFTIDFLFLS